MLICNNCGRPSADHVHQCPHCHMVDDFTHREDKKEELTESEAITEPPEKLPTCINCAATLSEQDDRCGQCHFPVTMPASTKTVTRPSALKIWKKTA